MSGAFLDTWHAVRKDSNDYRTVAQPTFPTAASPRSTSFTLLLGLGADASAILFLARIRDDAMRSNAMVS